ncbi:MAG: lipoate--protein ligase family protein [Chlamydiae bacterium]|nr:lipoate--protein ligase family protein [Chlamydiota bacterium]
MIRILNEGIAPAQEIMDRDEAFLEALDPNGEPILHLYEWEGLSITYGYFVDPQNFFYLEKVKEKKLQLARRPTGGGIVFHLWDLAFSFLMPSTHPKFSLNALENYQFVNQVVLQAVAKVFPIKEMVLTEDPFTELSPECRSFCMAKPTEYDVIFEGKKIAGAAQRKKKQGYLHQGTISLAWPDLSLLQEVIQSKVVIEAMVAHTFAPLGASWRQDLLQKTRHDVQDALICSFKASI